MSKNLGTGAGLFDIVDDGTPQDALDMISEIESTPEDDGNVEDDEEVEESDTEESEEEETEESDESDEQEEEGTEEEEVPQKKLAGMYNSVDELENAHKSLQTAYQGLKDALSKQAEAEMVTLLGGTAQPGNAPAKVKLTDLNPELVAKSMAENPQETLKLLANAAMAEAEAKVLPQSAKSKVETFRESHKDFGTYAARMSAILKENPAMANLSNSLDLAYKIAKAESLEQTSKKAMQNGIKKGYENAMSKGKAQVAQKGKPSKGAKSVPKTVEDDIADSIMSEAKRRNSIIF